MSSSTRLTVPFAASYFGATLAATGMSIGFVLSLYLWPGDFKVQDRDKPAIIIHRFISVTLSSIVSAVFCYSRFTGEDFSEFLRYIGLHGDGLLCAIFLPLIVVMGLFIGPLAMRFLDNKYTPGRIVKRYQKKVTQLQWWRNIIVAPLSEEFVFRSCMMPLLIAGGYSHLGASIVSPLVFGIAHLHHVMLSLAKPWPVIKRAIFQALFQFSYTFVFGMYTAFLFLRTGHFISVFLAHAFCNSMGLPRFGAVPHHPQKYLIGSLFVGGLIFFFLSIGSPLLNPEVYQSPFYPSG